MIQSDQTFLEQFNALSSMQSLLGIVSNGHGIDQEAVTIIESITSEDIINSLEPLNKYKSQFPTYDPSMQIKHNFIFFTLIALQQDIKDSIKPNSHRFIKAYYKVIHSKEFEEDYNRGLTKRMTIPSPMQIIMPVQNLLKELVFSEGNIEHPLQTSILISLAGSGTVNHPESMYNLAALRSAWKSINQSLMPLMNQPEYIWLAKLGYLIKLEQQTVNLIKETQIDIANRVFSKNGRITVLEDNETLFFQRRLISESSKDEFVIFDRIQFLLGYLEYLNNLIYRIAQEYYEQGEVINALKIWRMIIYPNPSNYSKTLGTRLTQKRNEIIDLLKDRNLVQIEKIFSMIETLNQQNPNLIPKGL